MSPSRYWGLLAIQGLSKMGDVYVPGDSEFPSFSKLGCVGHVDRVLDHLDPNDRKGLSILLSIFALLPHPLLKLIIMTIEQGSYIPGRIGSVFRLLRLGLKGIVMSLYYSNFKSRLYQGKSPHELIGFSVSVHQD